MKKTLKHLFLGFLSCFVFWGFFGTSDNTKNLYILNRSIFYIIEGSILKRSKWKPAIVKTHFIFIAFLGLNAFFFFFKEFKFYKYV